MTSPQPNPRRCYKTASTPPYLSHLPASTHHAPSTHSFTGTGLPLRKSATFHSPKSPSSGDDPILNIPLLPRRSPTSPKDLEDAVAAGERRVAHLLGVVDRSLSGLESFSSDSQDTLRGEDLPVPRFMLDARAGADDHMDIDDNLDHIVDAKPQQQRKHHSSDSGIGSTITGSEDSLSVDHAADKLDIEDTSSSIISEIQSGINGRSVTAQGGTQHTLGAYACRQIQRHIIVPILQEDTLKDFHPLVTGIPLRVGRKEITCLRDLEKVLLWLAPVSTSYTVWERSLAHHYGVGVKKFSISRKAFVQFCETSIQCLHTTVDYLNESDQRRPSDRPYTNGYFLDLTEQIRQYAGMITASRARIAAEKAGSHDDDTSDERLELRGGLGKTGRPAELVRIKNGESISLRTGDIVAPEAETKRSASQEAEDALLLSMGRRRKSAADRVKDIQRCRECDKEFKRPCDLTKHEKTHSRPWKCSDSSCKYSQYGWPTEKERDRHVNDKHSAAPSMFKCQYHPCPYESKRESNCKQHMEKAHGWAYVRSKNNGKSGRRTKASKTPPTPQSSTPGSHIFETPGSEFGDTASPYTRNAYLPSGSGSVGPSEGSSRPSNLESPIFDMEDNFIPFNQISWNPPPPGLTHRSPYTPVSHRLSLDSNSMTNPPTRPSSFDTSMGGDLDDPPLFNGTFDWSNLDTDFTSMNVQLMTPANSTSTRPLDIYSRNPPISLDQPHQLTAAANPNLSPGAQGNVMLYSPYANNSTDEGYEEFAVSDVGKPTNDFALFDDRPNASMSQGPMNMFQDLGPFAPTVWSGKGTEFTQQICMNELMEE